MTAKILRFVDQNPGFLKLSNSLNFMIISKTLGMLKSKDVPIL